MYQFGSLLAQLPEGWGDITDDVPVSDPPLTLAKAKGVGALQFSVALFLSGKLPNPTLLDLQRLLEERAVTDSWGVPISLETGTASMMFASGEFQLGQNYLRTWYMSDGANFVFATYNCEWDERGRERRDVEAIIRTLEFAEVDPEMED
ncbi:MAG: hypothetical protein K8T20_18875 [Planctomycetes bacterium]|nr:hypothetical protein [Planctomycetota bacterium]